jgi:hypothetical protein
VTFTQPARPAHVRQLMLPGQAAAPEGSVDTMAMYVMHHAFRRDLAAFAAAVPATPVEDRATWRRLQQRWDLFATVLHKHHSGEDAGLWPMLLDRVDAAGDAQGRRTLEDMEAEHGEIDPTLQACAEGFARLAEHPDADERAALAVRAAAPRDPRRRPAAAPRVGCARRGRPRCGRGRRTGCRGRDPGRPRAGRPGPPQRRW